MEVILKKAVLLTTMVILAIVFTPLASQVLVSTSASVLNAAQAAWESYPYPYPYSLFSSNFASFGP